MMKARLQITILTLMSLTTAQSQTVRRYQISSNDLGYDRTTGQILLTRGTAEQSISEHRLVSVDPLTGQFVRSVNLGFRPGKISLSSSGLTAYVQSTTLNEYYQINLSNFSNQTRSLGSNGSAPYTAIDLAPVPGSESSVAISRASFGSGVSDPNIAIYDNGVPRTLLGTAASISSYLGFSPNGSQLYGSDQGYPAQFHRFNVSGSGLTRRDSTYDVSSFGDFQMMGNFAVFNSGQVINCETKNMVAWLPVNGIYSIQNASPTIAVDQENQQIWFFESIGSQRFLRSYSTVDYGISSTIPLTGVQGTATSLIRWGRTGLAFRTTENQLFIINSAVVPEPASLTGLGIGALTLIRRRNRRRPARNNEFVDPNSL